jgi:hypothetical protein
MYAFVLYGYLVGLRRFLVSHSFEGRATQVSTEEARTWAASHNMPFFDVDAKSNRGISLDCICLRALISFTLVLLGYRYQ